ncbi:MAG: hypothetical protein ACKOET_03055 [Verrucomicrobiota bacterium]
MTTQYGDWGRNGLMAVARRDIWVGASWRWSGRFRDPATAQRPRASAVSGVTHLYTHVNIRNLIEVHRRTHPAKLPEPPSGACQPADGGHTLPVWA